MDTPAGIGELEANVQNGGVGEVDVLYDANVSDVISEGRGASNERNIERNENALQFLQALRYLPLQQQD